MLKKLISVFAVLSLSVFALSACGIKSDNTVSDTKSSQTTEEIATLNPDVEPADSMTLEEKVGQIFMVRCSENMDEILKKNPGAIIMFSNDFDDLSKEQVKAKIDGYKSAMRVEPYIAVDEEGGTVVRVSNHKALSPNKYESPQHYYKQGGIPAIIEIETEKAKLLTSLGISMNLAPVADITTNPEDFIYDRSIGLDPQSTADYVADVVKVMKKNNILSCMKHFPGYGSNVDTHTGIAVDERPLSQFKENDFLPFESGINAGADAILVSHNIITCVDETQPASISPAIHEIIRNDLGFTGLILTDDMSMGAMANYGTPYVKAVLAGNDMIIVSDFDTAYNEVLNAVKNGTIPEETLNAAVNRIVNKKNGK
ncbi:MAG: beta-hexosaminidase [Oscillospiraceae bacterium]|nr:beta-hexosaminidase [Oscillospiraceae bacterium]